MLSYYSKKIIFFLIRIYQKIFSPDKSFLNEKELPLSSTCVFYPSCSDYLKQSIEKYGIIKGFFKTSRRIIQCHPWQKKHIDLP